MHISSCPPLLLIGLIAFLVPVLTPLSLAGDSVRATAQLANGDLLRVHLHSLTPEAVTLHPAFAPDREMTFANKHVMRLDFAWSDPAEEKEGEAKDKKRPALDLGAPFVNPGLGNRLQGDQFFDGLIDPDPRKGLGSVDPSSLPDSLKPSKPRPAPETIDLNNFSILHGSFETLTDSTVFFRPLGGSSLAFPRGLVHRLYREESELSPHGKHHILLGSDVKIQGTLAQEGDCFVVEDKAVRARVDVSAMRSITFPATELSTNPPPIALSCDVTLRNGGRIHGTEPWLDANALSIQLIRGPEIIVPTKQIERIDLSEGGQITARRVMLWGQFADQEQELKRTKKVLEELKDWSIVMNNGVPAGREFRNELFRCRALVVAEMEGFDGGDDVSNHKVDGRDMVFKDIIKDLTRPLFQEYLRRGGRIIFCSLEEDELKLFKPMNFFDVSVEDSSLEIDVKFTDAGRRFSVGIGAKFQTTNATTFYKIKKNAEAWVLHDQGAPILGRRVGPGLVGLVGMDFYETNKATSKLLQNLITVR